MQDAWLPTCFMQSNPRSDALLAAYIPRRTLKADEVGRNTPSMSWRCRHARLFQDNADAMQLEQNAAHLADLKEGPKTDTHAHSYVMPRALHGPKAVQ